MTNLITRVTYCKDYTFRNINHTIVLYFFDNQIIYIWLKIAVKKKKKKNRFGSYFSRRCIFICIKNHKFYNQLHHHITEILLKVTLNTINL